MDAVEFLKEAARMCKSSNRFCSDCPLFSVGCGKGDPDETVDIVEQWSREHPVMTNAQKFKEVFGVGPEYCSSPLRTSETGNVLAHEWWNEPYKEPEGKE